jgi:hypothetical protein
MSENNLDFDALIVRTQTRLEESRQYVADFEKILDHQDEIFSDIQSWADLFDNGLSAIRLGYTNPKPVYTVDLDTDEETFWGLVPMTESHCIFMVGQIPTYNGVIVLESELCVLRVSVSAPAEHPLDTLLTLESLGKVHREEVPAYSDTSIYCS